MKSSSVGTKLIVNGKQVGGMTSVNGIDVNADKVDVTALDNASGYKEYVAGFKDIGNVTASGFLDGSDQGQSEVYTLLGSGAAVPCRIKFPAAIGKSWNFNASVVKFTTSADVGDAIKFDMELAPTGAPTLGPSPALSSIAVTTAPTKTAYTVGENFDRAGMVITATYADNSTAIVSDACTVTGGDNLQAGTTSVTISYLEGGVTKTVTQSITVTAAG